MFMSASFGVATTSDTGRTIESAQCSDERELVGQIHEAVCFSKLTQIGAIVA